MARLSATPGSLPGAKERLAVGWGGGRSCLAPTAHLSLQASISQVWKVLALGLCHSGDTAIRAEGTQRTKERLVPGTQPLWLLPGAPGTGCRHFLPPPCALPEEVWDIHPLDKSPGLKCRVASWLPRAPGAPLLRLCLVCQVHRQRQEHCPESPEASTRLCDLVPFWASGSPFAASG